ncbi:TIGR03885 family FMN-dependent LLM class oxidoreductase [Microbacterium sp. XT11]|uniref:TIGR03885 family FMN-dependent LLM class oxidoreductase n=1 Tax=Microbacterium sp. XT11 TaxID=367477 RepID=UPI000743008B|nr:TIGR03885 family FMN-dependent LLM class oxidoreductase [Microbacterium sp. XT11]ALX65650.1 N5,N10-methylene tetrahydromethanopterin reductase [Microbacterium sp. XT11]
MTVIGYHASHEQIPPGMLLAAVRLAETVGFDAAMCSDHLAPWSTAQGESGFAWSWIGAALARTDFPIGLVTAPGQRYHPVITAQALATVEEMFPGRFWAALGSGEALNEHVTGDPWPEKPARERRLLESVTAIRRLLAGERVTVDGEIRVHDARIWSLPASPPPLLGAAVSDDTATWVAGWADGLITVGSDAAATQRTREAYRGAGGRGDAVLQIHISLEDTLSRALEVAREQWSHATAPAEVMWDLQQPEDFEALADPTDEKLRQAVLISGSAEALAERIAHAARGFDHVYLHHVGTDQAGFLRRCGTELLPALREVL